MQYPQCLIDQCYTLNINPSFDIEWDRAIIATLKKRGEDSAGLEALKLQSIFTKAKSDIERAARSFPDLSDPDIYNLHCSFFLKCANEIVLAPQNRTFTIDEHNKKVLRFLLYYFNNCRLAESVFPERRYKIHKNILLKGATGVGKSIMMQCFSVYLHRIKSPRFFYNLSVTQMVNYYTIHSNLDRYTFNEGESKGFMPNPVNVCLNDIGLADEKVHFGTKTAALTDDFLYARNDIWAAYGKYAHLTTNLDEAALKKRFSQNDGHGRLIDRFKTYNVIELLGNSRR